MKIQKINFYNQIKRKTLSLNYSNTAPLKQDEICFQGKDKKPSFFDSLKRKLQGTDIANTACFTLRENQENLNDDEIKSESIKKFTGQTIATYGTVKKRGRQTISEIKDILYLGRKQNYKGATKYNLSDNANATFGDIDPNTSIPSKISVWEDGKYRYGYEILSTKPEIKYLMHIENNNLVTEQEGTGATITRLTQIDKNTGIIKQFDKTETGFNYLYGKLKENGENVEILKRLYFDFNNIKGCIYGEVTDEGIPLYFYNAEKDLWEEGYLLEFDE